MNNCSYCSENSSRPIWNSSIVPYPLRIGTKNNRFGADNSMGSVCGGCIAYTEPRHEVPTMEGGRS